MSDESKKTVSKTKRTSKKSSFVGGDLFKKLESVSKSAEAESKSLWKGTFREFLQKFEKEKGNNANIGVLAHQRVYNMIMSSGTEKKDHFGIDRTSYSFFENTLFGIEDSIDGVMSYLHSAAQKTETSRRMLLMFGPPSSGKCLSGDSLVYDCTTGQSVRIDDIVENGRRVTVCAFDEDGKATVQGITGRKCNGVKKTYLIKTSLGKEIKATANHKFLTYDGWKTVGELSVEDRIAVPRILPEPMKIKSKTLEELRFCAYIIGEGNCVSRVSFTNTEDVIRDEFVSDAFALSRTISPDTTMSAKEDGISLRIVKSVRNSRISNPLKQWLVTNNLWGKLAIEKECPSFVFQLPNNQLGIFLGRLYSCDGHISGNTINYCTASIKLAQNMIILLSRLGIVSKFRYKKAQYRNGKGEAKVFDSWQIDITDSYSVENFKKHISQHLVGNRLVQFSVFWEKFSNKIHRGVMDVFPSGVRHLIKSEMKEKGMKIHARNFREPGLYMLRTDRTTRNISRRKLSAVAEKIDSEKLRKLVDSDVCYDKIISIDVNADVKVYDIEVPRHHNFVSNGIVVHNSDLTSHLKRGLERYTRTPEGAIYALEGSKMHENPFLLIPENMRPEFEDKYGLRIEGRLSPLAARQLSEDLQGEFMEYPVEQIFLDEASRKGIGTWLPQDPKGQDQSELVGSIDFAKIQEYGDEADPRCYNFNGELNVANRGIMEFIEGIKADERFLRILLTATEEKAIKAPRFGLIYCDAFIILHTNEEEFKNFMAEKKYEAYHDRMVIVKVPYNLSVSNEVKIYEKLLQKSDAVKNMHIAPNTLKSAAMFSILSRLAPPPEQNDLTLVKKMKLYDKQHVKGFKFEQVSDMKKRSPSEGMSGMSPRFVIDQISAAISTARDENRNYITSLDVLRQLNKAVFNRDTLDKQTKNKYQSLIDEARREWDDLLKNDIQKAFFVSYEKEARNLCENYLDHIEAACSNDKPRDPVTGEEKEVDEKLMDSIEEQIDISNSGKEDFRNEILRAVGTASRKDRKFNYLEHAQLREAIQKKLFQERKNVIRLTVSDNNPDVAELKRINDVIARMVEQQDYSEAAANALLKYATAHLFDK